MKRLTCELCGGNELVKNEGVYVCKSCNTQYTLEEARKLMAEDAADATESTVTAESPVELADLYKAARSAREDGNSAQAYMNYEQIRMQDPDNWEPVFFAAYFSALNTLKNDSPGDSVQVTGGVMSLSGNYRSGLEPAINTISYCLDSVFDLIELINDYDEQSSAVKTVSDYIETIAVNLKEIIRNEQSRMVSQIGILGQQPDGGSNKVMNMYSQNTKKGDTYTSYVSSMPFLVEGRKKRIEETASRRRFEEFWAANQPLKAELESEIQALNGQIATLNNEIQMIPGYADMVNAYNHVQRLNSEKAALGLFDGNRKREIQAQIDSANAYQSQILFNINPSISAVQLRIAPLTNRINEINFELTKPR